MATKMIELAEYLRGKRRYEEAINLLLDTLIIDRNAGGHKLLTDIFKELGSSNELVTSGRKKMSKLLF